MSKRPTLLCLASYFKGTRFLEAAHAAGCHVILLTREKLAGENWPLESIDERFLMPRLSTQPEITNAVSYLARDRVIDRIVPLDDYDVLTAAALREHMRLPGLGQSLARLYRDKLAMRVRAQEAGIRVPDFSPVFNHSQLHDFMQRVPGPWMLKPRMEAGAMGIKKIDRPEELWHWLDRLGDEQSHFVLERFIPGRVYHVDGLMWDGQVSFSIAHKYARPPLDVAHEGGVFVTQTMPYDDEETRALLTMNEQLMAALGMEHGAFHSEFIRGEDGELYFLETAARVGGANIDLLVEAATGLNLWAEWANLEADLARGERYQLPETKKGYAGLLVCLARQEWPDLSAYNEEQVFWRLHKKHHAGIIVKADEPQQVEELIERYTGRFAQDFLAVAPPLDKAPE